MNETYLRSHRRFFCAFSRLPAIALLLVLAAPSQAWNDTGHMVVAEIAWRRLDAQTQARMESLAAPGASPRNNNFITAACWADDLKDEGIRLYDALHYIDHPWSDDGTPLPTTSAPTNVVKALEQCRSTLKNEGAPELEKASALRFLIHFVGDVHQPMHAISRYSQELPQGDRGGNLFKLSGVPQTNLHWFWDTGAGAFGPAIARPLTNAGRIELSRLAEQCIAAEPVAPQETSPFALWALESHRMAKEAAYADIEPDGAPSAEYSARAQTSSRKQVALAGYRLAAVLNELFQ